MTTLLPTTKPTFPLAERRWLSPPEAAAYLGVSVPTLESLGVEPSRRLGSRTPRYDRHELDRKMQDNKTDRSKP